MNRVLLIIPAHNEEACIESTLKEVIESPYDYIVVNDGSTDHTVSILKNLHANYLDLDFNLGIGGAVQTGYKYAEDHGYDIAVQFDADGQHDISSIATLITPIKQRQAAFTIGSRFIDKNSQTFKSSFLRRIGIRLVSNTIYLFSHRRIYDTTSGFRAAGPEVIHFFAEHYPLEYPEPISDFQLLKLGYRVTEVPVKMKKRAAGKSSIHSYKSAYYVINVLLSILNIQLGGHNE